MTAILLLRNRNSSLIENRFKKDDAIEFTNWNVTPIDLPTDSNGIAKVTSEVAECIGHETTLERFTHIGERISALLKKSPIVFEQIVVLHADHSCVLADFLELSVLPEESLIRSIELVAVPISALKKTKAFLLVLLTSEQAVAKHFMSHHKNPFDAVFYNDGSGDIAERLALQSALVLANSGAESVQRLDRLDSRVLVANLIFLGVFMPILAGFASGFGEAVGGGNVVISFGAINLFLFGAAALSTILSVVLLCKLLLR